MNSIPAPPQTLPPTLPRDKDFRTGFRLSIGIHVVLIVLFLIKSLVFPGKPIPYIPSLRVDIVGLPDILKKDLTHMPKAISPEIQKALDRADEEIRKSKIKVEKAQPDEMVLKPKAPSTKENAKDRAKKLKGALARIKALEKLTDDLPAKKPAGALIKGNMVSKGTTLSGDARESAVASYYDAMRERLQEFWELPVWVARKNLSAQVQVFIDGRGRVRSFKFLKLSGDSQFDSLVKRTLQDSQPFPVPPEGLASSLLVDGILVGFPL